MSLGMAAATTLGGVVTGMMVGDVLGSIGTTAAVPATSNASKPKATASGEPINTGAKTPRQSLYVSATYVVGAVAVLLLGSRFFKNARIS